MTDNYALMPGATVVGYRCGCKAKWTPGTDDDKMCSKCKHPMRFHTHPEKGCDAIPEHSAPS